VRAEFGVAADTEVVTGAAAEGVFPFLFAYKGKGMEFIKDAVPWGFRNRPGQYGLAPREWGHDW